MTSRIIQARTSPLMDPRSPSIALFITSHPSTGIRCPKTHILILTRLLSPLHMLALSPILIIRRATRCTITHVRIHSRSLNTVVVTSAWLSTSKYLLNRDNIGPMDTLIPPLPPLDLFPLCRQHGCILRLTTVFSHLVRGNVGQTARL